LLPWRSDGASGSTLPCPCLHRIAPRACERATAFRKAASILAADYADERGQVPGLSHVYPRNPWQNSFLQAPGTDTMTLLPAARYAKWAYPLRDGRQGCPASSNATTPGPAVMLPMRLAGVEADASACCTASRAAGGAVKHSS